MEATPLLRRRWKKFIYPVFIALFTLLAVELAGRWYLVHVLGKATEKKFRFNSYRVYEHVPGYREGELPDGSYRMTINGQGFRRRSEVAKKKPAGVYRIFLMGGSAAHGVSSAPPFPVRHLSDTETIDAVLERLLNTNNDTLRFEVINAAVTGYQLFQHTAYLQSELLDYDPDMVIFFDGANDHYTSNADTRYMLDYRFQFWKERLQEPSLGGTFMYMMNWLAEYSAACKAFVAWRMQRDARAMQHHHDLRGGFDNAAATIAAHRAVAPKQFLRSMHMNLDLLEREGVKAIVCLQPMLVLRDSAFRSPEEKALPWEDPDVQWLAPTVYREIDSLTQEHHVPFLDLADIGNVPLDCCKQIFIDDCHLTPLGASLCAQAMLDAVRTTARGSR
jgi:lysophospholipase L1-like esterase